MDLPYTLGSAARIQLSPRLALAGQGVYRTWSATNSDLLATGAVGSDNTIDLSFGGEIPQRHPAPEPPADPVRRALRDTAVPAGARASSRPRSGVSAGGGHELRAGPGRHRLGPGATSGARPGEFKERGVPAVVRRGGPALSQDSAGSSRPLSSAHVQTGLHRDLRLPDERGRLRADVRAARAGRATSATEEPADADVMLVNTCAVRDNAEQRVIGRMGELQRHKRPGDVLGVVGCMAQRLGPRLLEQVPRVDLVVGPDAYRNLAQLIGLAGAGQRLSDVEFRAVGALRGRPARAREGPHRVRHGTARAATTAAPSASSRRPAARSAAGGWRDVVREVGELAAARHHRGHAAGADGQLVSRRPARLRRPAARGRGGGRGPAGAVHQPLSDRLLAIASWRRWPTCRRCASTCTCRCRAAPTRCCSRMLRRYTREIVSRGGRAAPAAGPGHHLLHRHHRRLPRRDRGAVRRRR